MRLRYHPVMRHFRSLIVLPTSDDERQSTRPQFVRTDSDWRRGHSYAFAIADRFHISSLLLKYAVGQRVPQSRNHPSHTHPSQWVRPTGTHPAAAPPSSLAMIERVSGNDISATQMDQTSAHAPGHDQSALRRDQSRIVDCVGFDPAMAPDAATLLVGWDGLINRASQAFPRKYIFESSSSLAHLGNSHCRASGAGKNRHGMPPT